MPFNHAPHNSQPDAGAFELLGTVQSLKNVKEFIHIFHFEARAVVPHVYRDIFSIPVLASNFDLGMFTIAGVLHRVRQQVDQHLMQ